MSHSLRNWFSLNFHVNRFVGVGNMSYSDFMAKRILLDFIFKACSMVAFFLARTDCHLSQLNYFSSLLPWSYVSPVRLAELNLGQVLFGVALTLRLTLLWLYIPALANHALLSRCCHFVSSADLTTSSTCHFLTERSLIPAPLTYLALLSQSVTACLILATLYSSVRGDNGS